MTRLATVDPATASSPVSELFAAVKGKLGVVPNMMKTMASSPAVLKGYLNFSGALGEGKLQPKIRHQIAVALAQQNECGYCLAAHSMLSQKGGVAQAEIEAARDGRSSDAKAAAALKFARQVMEKRGGVSDADFDAIRKAGFSDGEIAEIIAHVALNVFTNFFNRAADTEVDFPRVELKRVPALA